MEKTKLNAIVFLALSIFLEVFATAMLKMSDGMQNLIPMGISIVGYLVSLYFLGLCLKTMPLSIAYAIWAGLGTILTLSVSVIVWGEAMGAMKIIAVLLIISGVVILNFTEEEDEVL